MLTLKLKALAVGAILGIGALAALNKPSIDLLTQAKQQTAQAADAKNYVQVLIHTADGGTYVVTGDLPVGGLVYKQAPNGTDFVACVTSDDSIGLPPVTNDVIFKDNFEADLCFQEF